MNFYLHTRNRKNKEISCYLHNAEYILRCVHVVSHACRRHHRTPLIILDFPAPHSPIIPSLTGIDRLGSEITLKCTELNKSPVNVNEEVFKKVLKSNCLTSTTFVNIYCKYNSQQLSSQV